MAEKPALATKLDKVELKELIHKLHQHCLKNIHQKSTVDCAIYWISLSLV